MQILFAISVLCFLGILWAAIAFARHIKAGQLRNQLSAQLSTLASTTPRSDFKYHLFAAPETSPDSLSITSFTGRQARQGFIHQSVHDIAANKQWTLPPHPIQTQRLPIHRVETPATNPAARKSVQPARYGPMELLDPAFYSKDMGDLTDPYQQPVKLRVNDRKQPSRGY